ncbi:MAG TPA: FAD-dependent oxidoreductase [Thermoanaerobaculia bacterium]|nr:FAD-dependent oxidoreductase [Thermoanaerobaculia bacterium]
MGGNTNFDSLWWKTSEPPRRAELPGDLTVDVAVVGAGMTGLTLAALLARSGREVAVVEAERVGAGTSGGTSAHVTQVLDHRYHELASKWGEEGARGVAASGRAGLERIAAFVAEEGIDCDFARVPGWLYTEKPEDAGRIDEEVETARKLGVEAARDDRPGLPFPVAAAVRFADQARFHPVAYLAGLADAAERAGARLYEGTRVRDVESGAPCRLETDRGVVTANAVVLATHTPAGFNLLQTAVEPMRSYVLALRLDGGAPPPDGLFWDTEEPYHYTRLQPGADGPLLVVGGADHLTGGEDHPEDAYRGLEAYARQRWPVAAVEHRWSSQFYEPIDGLPFIGHSPVARNLYVATGYSGTGLVLATLAGMLLADELQDRENPWADLYRTRRFKPLAGGPKFLEMNIGAARRFVGDRLAAEKVEDLRDVPPGEGRVVEWRGQKVAVFHEETGALHAVSAVCTHAFCLVDWNSAEKTWDCPCHGGRYRPDGSVIEGPPVADLAPVELEDDD